MKIQICHPNDLFANGWKTVEQISASSNYKEYITNPNFETFEGLLVRVVSGTFHIYDGIYGVHKPVDVSQRSALMKNTEWTRESSSSFRLVKGKSFPQFWMVWDEAPQMIDIIRNLIPRKTLVNALVQCIRAYEVMDVYKDALEFLDRGVEASKEERHAMIRKTKAASNITLSSREEFMLESMVYALLSITKQMYAQTALFYLAYANTDRFNGGDQNHRKYELQLRANYANHADILRRVIPFHEIALGIVRRK